MSFKRTPQRFRFCAYNIQRRNVYRQQQETDFLLITKVCSHTLKNMKVKQIKRAAQGLRVGRPSYWVFRAQSYIGTLPRAMERRKRTSPFLRVIYVLLPVEKHC